MSKKRVGLFCAIVAVLVMVFLISPLIIVVISSFSSATMLKFPIQEFSLKWYEKIFDASTHFMDGLKNSLLIGLCATCFDVILGVTAALSVTRHNFRGRNLLLNYFTSPMYVPSVAFSFVLLQVFSKIGGIPGELRVFAGHFIIIMPYIVRNTVSVLHSFNWNLEEAATSLGAGPVQVFFKVTLPLAKPGVLAGAVLAFLYSFDEVALSTLLTTAKFNTLPIRIMNYMELTFDPALAAISTLLIFGAFVVILLLDKLVGLDMFVK